MRRPGGPLPPVQLEVDGRAVAAEAGESLLHAIRRSGGDVPTLCHDERLSPGGWCRLCVVELYGTPDPVPACDTLVRDGMRVRTETPALTAHRRSALQRLADDYPEAVVAREPDVPLHRLFRRFGVTARGAARPERLDSSHPYLVVEMSRCVLCRRCVRICDEVQGQLVWRETEQGGAIRIVAGGDVPLAESACVACGACADTCPSGAIADKTVRERGEPTAFTRTTCGYCGTGCELSVGTRDGRIVAIRPVLDAPVSKGHLCVKGRYAFDYVTAKDRVTQPLLRPGGPGTEWRTASWDEAIGIVADRLSGLHLEHGAGSVGVLGSARGTNEEAYLVQKFARVALFTNNVDSCARVCHAPSAAALQSVLGTGAATSSFDDIELAGTILVVGSNATECHPVVGARIRQAARRGAQLLVIDPRRIELAEHAQLHLAPLPGTNVPVLAALAHVILDEGLVDETFLEGRVAGLDAFRASVADWTPSRAEKVSGVKASLLEEAARLYATGGPAIAFHGLGLTGQSQGTEAVKVLLNLALLTGNVGKPGTGVNPLGGQNNVHGALKMGCEPSRLTGFASLENGRSDFEAAWGVPLPKEPGLNLLEMMDAARDGRLKALYAIGYDLLLTNANAAATRDALRRLDLLVVQDLFLNETARELATVFLPVASAFEKEGTFMNADRHVQRVRQTVPPPPGVLTDWEILSAIAREMGFANQFRFGSAEEIWDEVRRVWPAGRGLTYSRLDERSLQWPCPSDDHPGTRRLHVDAFASGAKASLWPIAFRATPERSSGDYPFLLMTGRSLYAFNAGTMTGRTPNAALRPGDTLDVNPSDADRLRLSEGDRVTVTSRWGHAVLPVRRTASVKPGELFSTFHTPELFVNEITSSVRDGITSTPEYKVTAVALEKVSRQPSP